MPIAKRPTKSSPTTLTTDEQEAVAEAFIAGAGNGKTVPKVEKPKSKTKTPVIIRFDPDTLDRVDAAAKRLGLSRSSWVQLIVSQTLSNE